MKAFKVREALNAVGGRFYGEEAALDKEISFVTSDSRNAGPGSLFVAFKGARADGHARGGRERGGVPREPAGVVHDRDELPGRWGDHAGGAVLARAAYRYLRNSSLPIWLLCTSSGPSARRSARDIA